MKRRSLSLAAAAMIPATASTRTTYRARWYAGGNRLGPAITF